MKHSKYLNVALIDYSFQKQLIAEVISNRDYKSMITSYIQALKTLKLVKEELDIYNQLTDSYVTDKVLANKFLSEIKRDISKKLGNMTLLNKERQMFYEEVRKVMPTISEVLDSKIPRYKFYASIKNLIDDVLGKNLNAKDRVVVSENVVENLMRNTVLIENVKDMRDSNGMPKQTDPLVVSMMIKEFCGKWERTLSPTQYEYLVEYASSGRTINKQWMERLKKEFKSIDYKLIKDGVSRNKVINFLSGLNSNKNPVAEDILKYAEVLDTLNEVATKE